MASLPPDRMPPPRSSEDSATGSAAAQPPGRGLIPGLITALRLLLPVRDWPPARSESWSSAVMWLVPLGLLWGLLWAAVFRLSWRIFGEVAGARFMPALVVLLLDAAFLGARQYWGAWRVLCRVTARRTEGRSEEGGSLAPMLGLMLILLSVWVLILSVPNRPGYWPADWRATLGLNELLPRPIFRPLILAPIWGRWAMLMAANVGRVRPGSMAEGFCAAVRPSLVLGAFVPTAALTAAYCAQFGSPLVGLIIALAVLGVTHLASTLLGRRLGGQSLSTIFAVSLLAQITFLLAYLISSARV